MSNRELIIHPALAALHEFIETLEAMRLTYAGNVVMLKALCERVEALEGNGVESPGATVEEI